MQAFFSARFLYVRCSSQFWQTSSLSILLLQHPVKEAIGCQSYCQFSADSSRPSRKQQSSSQILVPSRVGEYYLGEDCYKYSTSSKIPISDSSILSRKCYIQISHIIVPTQFFTQRVIYLKALIMKIAFCDVGMEVDLFKAIEHPP